MAQIKVKRPDALEGYRKCEKCEAGLDHLYIGGVGDWRNRIVCLKCFHVREGVHFERVVVPLIAEQYGLSEEEALERENRSQAEYEETLERNAIDPEG